MGDVCGHKRTGHACELRALSNQRKMNWNREIRGKDRGVQISLAESLNVRRHLEMERFFIPEDGMNMANDGEARF